MIMETKPYNSKHTPTLIATPTLFSENESCPINPKETICFDSSLWRTIAVASNY